MHVCCWIVFLQHYAKMTKYSISQITEISFGGRISMEFALYTKVLWPCFWKKRKPKTLTTVLCVLWNMAYVSDAGLSWTVSLPTPVMEPQGIAKRGWAWLYPEQLRKTAEFWKVEDGRGLQVFIVLPRVLPHIPILILEIKQLWLGREYHFWAPAALRFSLEISYSGSY